MSEGHFSFYLFCRPVMPSTGFACYIECKDNTKNWFCKIILLFFSKKFLILEAFLFLSFVFMSTFGPIFWAIFADSLIIIDFLKKQMPFERYRKAFLKN